LVVDLFLTLCKQRQSLDFSVNTGPAPGANSIPIAKENANAQIDVTGEKRDDRTLEDLRFFLERLKLADTYSEKRPLH